MLRGFEKIKTSINFSGFKLFSQDEKKKNRPTSENRPTSKHRPQSDNRPNSENRPNSKTSTNIGK